MFAATPTVPPSTATATAPQRAPRTPTPALGIAARPVPRLIPCLWDGDGPEAAWERSREDLVPLLADEPGDGAVAVKLHTTRPDLSAPRVRQQLPKVALVVACGVDWIAREVAKSRRSVQWGVAEFIALATRAARLGAIAIEWNAEAGWKRAPTGPERARLDALVREALAAVARLFPELEQWLTTYDHPTYHRTFPWRPWVGEGSPVRRIYLQVYAAPGDGLMAHRGALPRREAAALSSYRTAVREGLIRADAPAGTVEDLTDVDWNPYYQLHSVQRADTVQSAVRHASVSFWALRARSDGDGRSAVRGLVALHRLGFWGEGALRRAQARYGLKVDDVFGAESEGALARAAGISVARAGAAS